MELTARNYFPLVASSAVGGITRYVSATCADTRPYNPDVPKRTRIGLRIKEVREQRGDDTQDVVAQKSGDPKLSGNYISKVEAGHLPYPGWRQLLSIAKGLDTDVSVITAPVGAPIPPKGKRQTQTDSTSDAQNRENRSSQRGERGAAIPSAGDTDLKAAREFLEQLSDALDKTLRALNVRAKGDRTGTE